MELNNKKQLSSAKKQNANRNRMIEQYTKS